jgi:hypothetical protein
MAHIPDEVLQIAEDPSSRGLPWPGSEVVTRPGLVMWLGPPYYPGLVVVQRVRLSQELVSDAVAETRAFLKSTARSRAIWSIGPSATPTGLCSMLTGMGMQPDVDPVLKMLVLTTPPPPPPDDVVVRRATTTGDFELFFDIQQRAFEAETDQIERGRSALEVVAEDDLRADHAATYLAYIDGEPVATARATFKDVAVVLNGGSTLHHARGRGAYRALVSARWADAVARGLPFLTTQARHTSYPTLKKLGFVDVGDIEMLTDEF